MHQHHAPGVHEPPGEGALHNSVEDKLAFVWYRKGLPYKV